MTSRRLRAALLAASLITGAALAVPARADNQMGYRELSVQDASRLPRNGGGLGMDIERAQRVNESGLSFDIVRITDVRRGSAGEAAGFHRGDQIIAVDGRVFESLQAFAAYINSIPPGRRVAVDILPNGGGPQQAERVTAVVGDGGRAVRPRDGQGEGSGPGQGPGSNGEEHQGMSLRTKIGIGAVALFGCYELGCFSHR